MEIVSLQSFSSLDSGLCATIGFFDGVHKGHLFLLNQLQEVARKEQQRSMVITFRNPPRACLQAGFIPQLLTSTEEKLELISQTGIDYCFLLDFTQEIANMTAGEFIRQILSERLNVKNLLIGHDHRFGRGRNEGFEDYVNRGKTCGIEVILAKELSSDVRINSTLIRNKIQNKAIEDANVLLGRPYSLKGKVIHGNQIGQKIGFPTANLSVSEPYKIIPPEGIYAVYTSFDGRTYPGMAYIGKRPTVSKQEEKRIEVHIIDFSGDLYGKTICLEFIKYLRDDQQFESLEELQQQLTKDKGQILGILL